MTAAALLPEAKAAGVELRVENGAIRLFAVSAPPPEFLARLRVHKPELIELLRGDRCRHCGERLVWSRPGAVAFNDGLAAHLACYEQAEAEKARRNASARLRRGQPTAPAIGASGPPP